VGSVFVGLARERNLFAADDPNQPDKAEDVRPAESPKVPRRKLGKTGIDVPALALGADFNFIDKQIVLRKCLDYGVNYWDSSYGYAGGNSELGIGKFFEKNPEMRKDVFLVSKAQGANSLADVEKYLQESLKRLNTDYIDLYCVHSVEGPSELNDELRKWAEGAKQRRVIKFFGFSTHKNMASCLSAAADVGWVDVVMTLYNFRFLQDDLMNAAIEKAHKAGLGLLAMKTQALMADQAWIGKPTADRPEEQKKLIDHFRQRGFTEQQAKIKVVMDDERLSSVCVGIDSIATLKANVAVALGETKLSAADKDVLNAYDEATCSGYCAGCGAVCESPMHGVPCVSDVMRCLMYYHSYNQKDKARRAFSEIPRDIRTRLLTADYRAAEARCPRHLKIEKLMKDAVKILA